MIGTDKSPWNSMWLLQLCLLSLVSALVYLFAKGAISAREFGAGVLLLAGCLFVVMLYRYRGGGRYKEQDVSVSPRIDAAKTDSARRKLRIAIVVLPVLLVAGLWQTKGEPLLPRTVGAGINVVMTAWFIYLLRKTKNVGDTR